MKIHKKGYSLVELSIVVIILSVLVSGGLSIITGSANNSKIRITRERMNEVYKAMGNYLLANGALPCPASILEIKSSSSTYGTAGTTVGVCNVGAGVYAGSAGLSANLVYGMVPVQTLGLSADMAEDAFGNKFTYIVSKGFTDPNLTITTSGFGSIFPATGFTVPTAGFITIRENIGGSFQVNTNDAIFAIISHGGNKTGGFGVNVSNPTQVVSPIDADEQNNYATTFSGSSNGTAVFYNTNNYLSLSAINSDTFDDIILYKARNSMVSDFDALSLIACPATSGSTVGADNLTIFATTFSWPVSRYNQIVPSTVQCPVGYQARVKYPTRRCGAFGLWETSPANNGVINPCSNT